MIIRVTEDRQVIPHFSNILEIYEKTPGIASLNQFNPIFLGGYPMSLLLAPRREDDITKIRRGYYNDYDIYFNSEEDFQKAFEFLDKEAASLKLKEPIVTDNARTYISTEKDIHTNLPLTLQLINKTKASPVEILETFDFINCAVGFTPHDKALYFHKDLFKVHNEKELEVLNPWMLDEVTEETTDNVIVQIARFKKYCLRWGYTLGNHALLKLLEVYVRFPNLKTRKAFGYKSGAVGYEGFEYIAKANQNIWQVLAPLIQIHPLFKEFKDPHGILSKNTKNTRVKSYRNLEAQHEPLNDDIPF